MKHLRTTATAVGVLLILSMIIMDHDALYRLILGMLIIFTSLACTHGADGNTWEGGQ